MKYLDEARKLNLPLGQYAIFGSGPIAVRGWRENSDIDIIVKPELWDELCLKYPVSDGRKIEIGVVEIYGEWAPWFSDVDELIDSAEMIKGLPFVRLKRVIEWKKATGREKDLKLIASRLREE